MVFRHFENLALNLLDKLYTKDRHEAFRNLMAQESFKLGEYLTPMLIASDSGAKKFLGHTCCQTLLKLIWMNYMDLDTPAYKLVPWISFFNIHWIKFDDEIFKYAKISRANGNEAIGQQGEFFYKNNSSVIVISIFYIALNHGNLYHPPHAGNLLRIYF